MRIIPKYQQGGIGIIPVTYTPIPKVYTSVSGGGTQTVPSSTKTEDELFSKDIIKALTDKALPSDMTAFVNNASLFTQSLYSPGYNYGNTKQDIAQLLVYMNRMAYEKNMFDKAITNINAVDGMSEAAIGVNGGIYVVRDNNIQNIGINDLRENDVILSNGQLANIRANSAAFDSNITSTLNNATSLKQVRSTIQEALQNLGNNESSNNYYVDPSIPQTEEIYKLLGSMNIGLEELQSMDADSIIEINTSTEDNTRQLKDAINAIYEYLPANQRTLLALRAKEIGIDDPRNLIVDYVSSRQKGKRSITMDIKGSSSGSSKSGKSSSKDSLSDLPLTPGIALLMSLGDKQVMTLNEGRKAQIQAIATNGALTDSSGKALGQDVASKILTSSMSAALDTGNITLGGSKIDPTQLNYIVLKDSNVAGVNLPIDLARYRENGVITPDIELAKKAEEVAQYIKSNNITDINQINKIYKDNGLPELYTSMIDEYGNPILNNSFYRRFIAANVMADKKAFAENAKPDENSRLSIYREKDPSIEWFDSVIQASGLKDFEHSDDWLTWGDTSVFGGILYIPMRDNAINAYLTANENVKIGQGIEMEKRQQENEALQEKIKNYKPTDRTSVGL